MHIFSTSHTVMFSLCLTFYLSLHMQLWENWAGSRKGAGSRDERHWWRCGGKIHCSLQWRRHLSANGENTSHRRTGFQVPSLSARAQYRSGPQAHIYTTTWFIHAWTNKHIVTLSLHLFTVTMPKEKQRQPCTKLINRAIVPVCIPV